MDDPELIIIDEPTEGQAPKLVEGVGQFLRQLKACGIEVLLVHCVPKIRSPASPKPGRM